MIPSTLSKIDFFFYNSYRVFVYYFHNYLLRALVPYKARGAGEISFNQGEILCVTNSHVIMEPGQPYKWKAIKEEMSGTYQISGLIPRQIR